MSPTWICREQQKSGGPGTGGGRGSGDGGASWCSVSLGHRLIHAQHSGQPRAPGVSLKLRRQCSGPMSTGSGEGRGGRTVPRAGALPTGAWPHDVCPWHVAKMAVLGPRDSEDTVVPCKTVQCQTLHSGCSLPVSLLSVFLFLCPYLSVSLHLSFSLCFPVSFLVAFPGSIAYTSELPGKPVALTMPSSCISCLRSRVAVLPAQRGLSDPEPLLSPGIGPSSSPISEATSPIPSVP